MSQNTPPTTPYNNDEERPSTPPPSTANRSLKAPHAPGKKHQCPGCAENQTNQEAHMGPYGCLGDWEDFL